MGTKLAVASSNLVAAYEKIKMFALLPQLYTQDFVDFFIRDNFWFSDEVFHKWLENFDFDADLKFIFENPFKSLNFLDINLQIVENNLVFDIYYEPTNSFNNDNITFIRTYNPNHNINLKKFHRCLDKIKNKELKTCFLKKKSVIIY